jgi:sulfite exporter TauE/SafE
MKLTNVLLIIIICILTGTSLWHVALAVGAIWGAVALLIWGLNYSSEERVAVRKAAREEAEDEALAQLREPLGPGFRVFMWSFAAVLTYAVVTCPVAQKEGILATWPMLLIVGGTIAFVTWYRRHELHRLTVAIANR